MGALLGAEEQQALLRELGALVRARGVAPLVSARLLEPRPEDFPDRWRADEIGVERLARRLLTYAGLGQLGVVVDLFEGETTIKALAADGRTAQSSEHQGAAAWFAGIVDGRCVFGADARKLGTPEVLAGAMAHEAAHAFRRFHALEVADRDEEERLTDLTTIYLGFGVLTTNAAYRYRQKGELLGAYTRTEWSHQSLGYLSPQAMSFLLAAQAVLRGLDRSARRHIAGLLETNQAAYFRSACGRLDRGSLIAELGLPPPNGWPVMLVAAPVPFATSRDPPPPPDATDHERDARQRQNQGLPVFRVRETSAVLLGTLGAAIGLGGGVAVGLATSWWAAAAVFVAASMMGRAAGRQRARDRCSEPECTAVIPPEAQTCPGCGGTISGRIAKASERLDARERLEGGGGDDGADPLDGDDGG